AGVPRPGHRVGAGPPEVLQGPGRHPPAAGEQPRSDHAPGVVVVPLVPAVVGLLVPLVGVDHGQQHAARPDRVVVDPPGVERVVHRAISPTARTIDVPCRLATSAATAWPSGLAKAAIRASWVSNTRSVWR